MSPFDPYQSDPNQPDPYQPDPNQSDPHQPEPRLITRGHADTAQMLHPHHPAAVAAQLPPAAPYQVPTRRRRPTPKLLMTSAVILAAVLLLAGGIGYLYARHWVRSTTAAALPQLDGTLSISGLKAPVTVQRDAQGVPHIHAQSLDDLLFAQAFITTSDRLFQMDLIRRHAAGELSEVVGAAALPADKTQRVLQIRAAADRAVTQLPPDQLHILQVYADGVNASIAQQSAHLPIEFHILGYTPAPWTPRDSILVQLAMFEDLTNEFPAKLAHEALTAQLIQSGAAALIPDLYPITSWRDHPPASAVPDLTIPGPPIEQVPLDESQSSLQLPTPYALHPTPCSSCFPGSNNWVVSGAHTASGKPLLSNDMHLTHTLPGIWYEADLEAPIPNSPEPLHVAGVTIPGLPLIVVGHNNHIAWGFTNLGADVQDIYVETTRGSGDSEEFQAPAFGDQPGTWHPILHLTEKIKVKHGRNVTLNLLATQHGNAITPLLNPLLQKSEQRALALRWTIYDPTILKLPVYDIATAHDWPSFEAAFSQFPGPAQNVVYADDQGHIGYHASGKIPLRGPATPSTPANTGELSQIPSDLAPVPHSDANATQVLTASGPLAKQNLQPTPDATPRQLSGPLSAVPLAPSAAHEWSGYIPFDQLPQVFDPPSGVIATANARVAPDGYPYPITLDPGSSYRTERILHLLMHRNGLTPADMLAIQTDVYSDFDHVLAQRLAYAIDRSTRPFKPAQAKQLHQAADLLRTWNGRVNIDSSAAAIVAAVHADLWPLLLKPHLKPGADPRLLYIHYARDFALEELITHAPARWLPPGYTNWDDFLAAAVLTAIDSAHAPNDLARWRYGTTHTVDIEHPIFDQSDLLKQLLGRPTGTGPQPQSGDGTTVKQVGHTFGPSERFTADLSNLDHSTLNIVAGQSGNPDSPWFLDQFPAWYHGTTYLLPFTDPAVTQSTTHTLTLTPR
jgi:penicillin amidase